MYFTTMQRSVICGVFSIATIGCGPADTSDQTQSTSTTTVTTTTTSGTSGTTTTGTTPTTGTTSTTIDTTNLYGTLPAKAIPAPKFTAYSHEDEMRTREDLIGHPTVLWFFPFADTPG